MWEAEDLIDTIFQKGFNWPITSEHFSSLIDIAVYKEIMMGRKVFVKGEKKAGDRTYFLKVTKQLSLEAGMKIGKNISSFSRRTGKCI